MARSPVVLPQRPTEIWDVWRTQLVLRNAQGQAQAGCGGVSLGPLIPRRKPVPLTVPVLDLTGDGQ